MARAHPRHRRPAQRRAPRAAGAALRRAGRRQAGLDLPAAEPGRASGRRARDRARTTPSPGSRRCGPRSRRSPRASIATPKAGIEDAIAAPHERFSLDAAGRITWDDRPLGQLARGATLLLPEAKLAGLDGLGPGARSRVLRRLFAFARNLASELLAPLHAPELRALEAAGRGLVYQLEQGLGTALAERASEQLAGLSAADRGLLAAQGVILGERTIYLPALLKPRAVERRAALCAAWFDSRARPLRPRASAVSLSVGNGADPRAYLAIGFPLFAGRAIRANVVERAVSLLATGPTDEGAARLSSVLGCPGREVPGIVAALERSGRPVTLDTAPLDEA